MLEQRRISRRGLQLISGATLVIASAIACGGDDTDDGDPAGSAGTAGSDAGSGNGAGNGGMPGGGTTSVAGEAGSTNEGGEGGEAGDTGEADAGGAGGAGGAEGGAGGTDEFAPITEVADVVITEVNEIRGLSYAADGKIWASGFTDIDPDDRQLAIVRFTEEGELDTTFADEGVLVLNIAPGGDEQSRGIVELENGDLIVQVNIDDGNGGEAIEDTAGVADPQPRPDGRNVVLLRLDAEGELVESFGEAGIATIEFGWSEAADALWPVPTYDSTADEGEGAFSGDGFPEDDSWGIALDTSGDEERIVVFGYGPAAVATEEDAVQRFDNDRYVSRVLASDGTVDPDFNDGSVFTLASPGGFADNARRGIVEPDGAIMSAGYANFGEGFGNHVLLLRLLPDGTLDPDFGFGIAVPGLTRFNPFLEDGGMAECYAVARQSNGLYVTTGYGYATGPDMTSQYGYATSVAQDLVAFGVSSDGLDLAWGNQGTLAIQSEEAGLGDTQDRGRDLVVLSDDRAVHAGRFGPNPAIFVTIPDGELDTSVGDAGKFLYEPFEDTSHFFVIAANQDKSRIAAATSSHPDGVVLAILQVDEE